jgi:hypothetical protein
MQIAPGNPLGMAALMKEMMRVIKGKQYDSVQRSSDLP